MTARDPIGDWGAKWLSHKPELIPTAASAPKPRAPRGSKKAERERRAAGFAIVIDSREQLPYDFTGLAPTVRKGLPSGDYSIVGLEDKIALERKGLNDCWGTMGAGRERFYREMERLRSYDYAAIVIESTLRGLRFPPKQVQQLTPGSVINGLLAITIDYGVHVFFAEDRDHGRQLTYELLRRFYNRAIEKGMIEVPELPRAE